MSTTKHSKSHYLSRMMATLHPSDYLRETKGGSPTQKTEAVDGMQRCHTCPVGIICLVNTVV